MEEAFRSKRGAGGAPKPGRDPLGEARFDPALRVHQRASAQSRSIVVVAGRMGSRASAGRLLFGGGRGLDEPADQSPRSTAPVPLLLGAGLVLQSSQVINKQ